MNNDNWKVYRTLEHYAHSYAISRDENERKSIEKCVEFFIDNVPLQNRDFFKNYYQMLKKELTGKL